MLQTQLSCHEAGNYNPWVHCQTRDHVAILIIISILTQVLANYWNIKIGFKIYCQFFDFAIFQEENYYVTWLELLKTENIQPDLCFSRDLDPVSPGNQ